MTCRTAASLRQTQTADHSAGTATPGLGRRRCGGATRARTPARHVPLVQQAQAASVGVHTSRASKRHLPWPAPTRVQAARLVPRFCAQSPRSGLTATVTATSATNDNHRHAPTVYLSKDVANREVVTPEKRKVFDPAPAHSPRLAKTAPDLHEQGRALFAVCPVVFGRQRVAAGGCAKYVPKS
jgi:hypothetical protein